jgi:nitrogen fixation protein NifB
MLDRTLTASQDNRIEKLAAVHPCFTEAAALRHGRMHLPVAPRCNLGCNYCERTIGPEATSIGGPGSAERLISPDEAAVRVDAINPLGWLHVVGIAGPAEPLASPETFQTLRLVHAAHPELVLCLSTNGLNLEQALPDLIGLGLRALTVTINTTDPRIASLLYAWADGKGDRMRGVRAMEEVVARQWRGLAAAVEAGLLVKVNSVLIPEINDVGLVDVARRAADLGAHRQNIMPLIPRGRMRDRRPPSREELAAVQQECERWIPQFRGCTQCPADVIEPPLLSAEGGNTCAAQSCASAMTKSCMPTTA